MNSAPPSFHPEAAEEAEAAVAWYARRSIRAPEKFVQELEICIQSITNAPHQWPPFEGNARRVFLRRFPYSVVYCIRPSEITIIAVAHSRRRPRYWRDRVEL